MYECSHKHLNKKIKIKTYNGEDTGSPTLESAGNSLVTGQTLNNLKVEESAGDGGTGCRGEAPMRDGGILTGRKRDGVTVTDEGGGSELIG